MKNGDSYVMADMASAMLMTVRQSFVGSAKHEILGTVLNVLLICVPLALLSKHFQVGNSWIFVFSLVESVRLAERLGFITEQLAFFTGRTEKRGCDKSIINLQDVLGRSSKEYNSEVDGKQHWILTHTPVCSECKSLQSVDLVGHFGRFQSVGCKMYSFEIPLNLQFGTFLFVHNIFPIDIWIILKSIIILYFKLPKNLLI